MHRLQLSDEYRDTPTAIRHVWAFRDVIEAHQMLDFLDAERTRVRQRQEQEARHARR